MPDKELLSMKFPVRDTVRKWNPGSDLNGAPDDVTEVEYLAEVPAAQGRAVKRLQRRWNLMAITVAVGLSLLTGHAGGLMVGGLATIGASAIADAIIGGGTYTAYNNGNAYLGVGDDSTAFSVGQTDLQAATNKQRLGMDASYPSRASNVITFRATAGSSDANFAWLENGVFNASTSGQMLVRKAVNLGTKVSGATWEFTKTLTITAG